MAWKVLFGFAGVLRIPNAGALIQMMQNTWVGQRQQKFWKILSLFWKSWWTIAKFKAHKITAMVNIFAGNAFTIFHEKFGSQWNKINNELTIQSIVWHCLALFTCNKLDFLHSPFHCGVVQCRVADESSPKTLQSAGKAWCQFLWDADGIIYINYLEKGKPININFYIELLVHLMMSWILICFLTKHSFQI